MRFLDSGGKAVIASPLLRNLTYEMIKSALSKRVCSFAFFFGERFGSRKPIEDELAESFCIQPRIGLNLTLDFFKPVEASQDGIIALTGLFVREVLIERRFDDGGHGASMTCSFNLQPFIDCVRNPYIDPMTFHCASIRA